MHIVLLHFGWFKIEYLFIMPWLPVFISLASFGNLIKIYPSIFCLHLCICSWHFIWIFVLLKWNSNFVAAAASLAPLNCLIQSWTVLKWVSLFFRSRLKPFSIGEGRKYGNLLSFCKSFTWLPHPLFALLIILAMWVQEFAEIFHSRFYYCLAIGKCAIPACMASIKDSIKFNRTRCFSLDWATNWTSIKVDAA